MNYEQKYKEALERAKDYFKANQRIGELEENDILSDIFPELNESEDERIRKWLIEAINFILEDGRVFHNKVIDEAKDAIAWLEKQGEHANFRNKIQIGDKVTKNEDGVLVNLSQLNRVAKKKEKQDEQKVAIFIPKFRVGDKLVSTKNPRLTYEVLEVGHINELGNPEYKVEIFTDGKVSNPHNIHYMECYKVDEWAELIEQKSVDNVKPKFKIGDWIVDKSGCTQQVLDFRGGIYTCTYNSFTMDSESNYHLWTINDAKDGDVLASANNQPFIYNGKYTESVVGAHIGINFDGVELFATKTNNWTMTKGVKPATKEERDLLFQRMKEDGYKWNADEKVLNKVVIYE